MKYEYMSIIAVYSLQSTAYSINHNPNEANTVQYHHSHLHPSCTSHPHQPHALPTPNPPIPIHPSIPQQGSLQQQQQPHSVYGATTHSQTQHNTTQPITAAAQHIDRSTGVPETERTARIRSSKRDSVVVVYVCRCRRRRSSGGGVVVVREVQRM